MNLKKIRLYLNGATDGKHIIEGWHTRADQCEPLFTETVEKVTVGGAKILPAETEDGAGSHRTPQQIVLEGTPLDVDFRPSRCITDGTNVVRADIQVSKDDNRATIALERI